ncbi:MAG: aminoacyl-tRNA hydrolase [Candidatus Omnitrophica bacterium]|nr:aminoacyl-tRNA hydrolase [Candidatus Omnitrophota bacterium]
MKLIVGLGNPGRDYEMTRHNLGYMVAQYLAESNKLKFGLSSFTKGVTAEGIIAGQKVCLLMPLTYMNNSGLAVKSTIKKKKIDCSDMLIVCDDMDVVFGKLRLRPSGSDGGNNGIKSIIAHLETKDFSRLRMGIGRPANKEENVDFVLSEFNRQEKQYLDEFIKEAAQCCIVWLKDGIVTAMDQFNKRKGNG